MSTGDTAARNERGDNFATDYATATLDILDGATVLASHTLTGFAASVGGVIAGNAIANVNASATGTADGATLSNGVGSYALTVGLSGADVNLTTLSYVSGEPSAISAFTVTFPA